MIATDSCSGDPCARRVLNGPEFRCDPDSDRMLCRQWIPSAMDTSVRETGVTVCLLDIPADIDSNSHMSFLAPQRSWNRTVLNDYCTPDLGSPEFCHLCLPMSPVAWCSGRWPQALV